MLGATPDQVLLNYGALGVFALVAGAAILRMFNIIMRDRDKAIADRDAMIQDQMTQVLPLVLRSTDVLDHFLPVLEEANQRLAENTRAFEEIKYILIHGRGNSNVGGS